MVGSSRMSRSGSWISEQHSDSFCFIPPESFPAGRSGNGSRPVARSKRSMRTRRSARDWPNSRPKKSMFSNTDRRRIEIAAQSLRHVGDTRRDGCRDAGSTPYRRRACGSFRTASGGPPRSGRAVSTCRRHRARQRRWRCPVGSRARHPRWPSPCHSGERRQRPRRRRLHRATLGNRGVEMRGPRGTRCHLHIGIAGQARP